MITIDVVNSYTANGIIIHPLVPAVPGDRNTGKAPTVGAWQSRTTPYETAFLERELSKGANIGANCGRASDLTVVDVDYYVKGIWDYVFNGINTTKFVTQIRTERDGKKHYLFRHCPDVTTCTNKELGFDIRNDGGNIVLAPSIHCEGDTYKLLAPIENRTVLPSVVALRINEIIGFYKDLKTVFAKCRPCFYKLWKAVFTDEKSEIYHDTTIFRQAEGRLRHLSLFAELKANGASDEVLILACWLIFGEYFDEIQTVKGIRGIDPKKTPKNSTLQADEYYSKFLTAADDRHQQNATEGDAHYRILTHDEVDAIRQTHDTLRLNINLPEDHFVSEFVKWTDSLNDGYKEYKVITAFWLLSALVQQKVYSRWSTGTIYPNVWAFLIGPSTISRKTTVVDNGRDIYKAATGNDIPDTDYSLEGYAESLSQTPILNCVRDEVSTLLSKMGQKYNDGYFEFECSMYDGKQYVKTLASKGKKEPETFKVENTYITKLYATTPVKLAESISTKNFDSGFGFRFLFASPSYSRELKGHRTLTSEDTVRWASVMERTRRLNNFFTECPVTSFGIEPDAERFFSDKTLEIVNKLANEAQYNETLLAVWGRLETYIIKLAMLIEIGKKQVSLTITMESLLLAFSMVCNYFVPSTIAVYNKLLEDDKFNKIEKIIKELRKLRGASTHTELLKSCKLVAKDFKECIDTMEESGAIEVVIAKGANGKEAKTYILTNENANIVPKGIFNLEKLEEILKSSQVPQALQVPKVSRVSYVGKSVENLESLDLNRGISNTNNVNCDNTKTIETLTYTTQQLKNIQTLQHLLPSPNIRELGNLGNLESLENLDESKPQNFCGDKRGMSPLEVSAEEANNILDEEGI